MLRTTIVSCGPRSHDRTGVAPTRDTIRQLRPGRTRRRRRGRHSAGSSIASTLTRKLAHLPPIEAVVAVVYFNIPATTAVRAGLKRTHLVVRRPLSVLHLLRYLVAQDRGGRASRCTELGRQVGRWPAHAPRSLAFRRRRPRALARGRWGRGGRTRRLTCKLTCAHTASSTSSTSTLPWRQHASDVARDLRSGRPNRPPAACPHRMMTCGKHAANVRDQGRRSNSRGSGSSRASAQPGRRAAGNGHCGRRRRDEEPRSPCGRPWAR